jgi:hypothetical protein
MSRVLPCKIVLKGNELHAYTSMHGEQVFQPFSILHIDPARMKWVSAQEARSAEHLQSVEGRFDKHDPRLYYAYGEVQDTKVPGKAISGYSHALILIMGRDRALPAVELFHSCVAM